MGPNGSGKSTLANAIMGHPNLEVTEGQILFDGEDITEADPDERARAGLFMAFQYPVAIPGVTVTKYLRMVMNAHREARGEQPISLKDFRKTVEAAMELTNVPREFSSRYLNEGFSGGEKKRMEILQLALQQPKLAVLDETDSGLDIDALNTVAHGVNAVAEATGMGALIITHYQRILHIVQPEFVHIMFEGRIVKEGGPELVDAARGARLRLDPREVGGGRSDSAARLRRRRRFPSSPRRRALVYLDSGATSQTPRGRDRGDGRVLPRVPRERSTAASTRSRRGRPRPTRARASRSRAFTGSDARRDGLHPQRDRGDQPRRRTPGAAPTSAPATCRRHADGAPLQPRAVAAARAARRARARLRADRRRRAARPRRARRAARARRRSSSPSPTSPTCSARSTRSPRSSRARTPPARSCWSTARRPCRTCRVDVRALGADFYAWTGHKAYGPTGIGVLHGRRELLEAMPPFLGGGHMIAGRSTSRAPRGPSRPRKFEAGTPPIAEAIGLGAAVDYLDRARAWTPCASTRATSSATRSSALARGAGADVHGPRGRRPRGSARLVRARRRPPARRRGDPRPRRASACAPATTARSR